MSHTYAGWVEQVAGERIAGQPLDTTFWDKWSDRYQAHRQRDLPGWKFGETNTFVGGGFEVLSETTEIYIPPYAVGIQFRCHVAVVGTFVDPFVGQPVGAIVHSRFKVGAGADYSSIDTTSIGCKIGTTGPPDFDPVCTAICPGCDGDQDAAGVAFKKTHLFVVPEAMKDTVQAVQVEFQRGHTNTISGTYNFLSPPNIIRPWSILEVAA